MKSLASYLDEDFECFEDATLGGRLNERLEDVLVSDMGDPHSENENELRWGNRGSLSVVTKDHADKKRGMWFSHEDNKGGGGILSLLGWKWSIGGAKLTEKATELMEGLPAAPQRVTTKKPTAKPDQWTADEAIDKFWDEATSLRKGDKSAQAYLKSRGIHSTKLNHNEVRQVKHKATKKAATHQCGHRSFALFRRASRSRRFCP